MPINPNIPLQFRLPQLQGPLEQASQVAQLQHMFDQSALAKLNREKALRAQQQEEAFRTGVEGLGEAPTQEALVQLAAKFGSPDKVLTTHQASMDRKAAIEARDRAVQNQIDQRIANAEMMHEFRMSQAKTDEARAAETARHNRAIEGIQLEIAKIRAERPNAERSQFFTFLPTPEGYVAGNARTGEVSPVTIGGKPVIRSTDSPPLQRNLAGAKTTGTAEAKRTFNMSGIGAALKQAEDILQGKDPATGRPRPKPTGSTVGSIYDSAAGLVGLSPEGSKEAQSLKALGGALVAKMPRMEGPQSDRDVQLYREMAAEIGNDTVPRDRRLQALEVVKSLWQKYEHLNQDQFGQPQGGGAPNVPGSAPEGVDPADWAVMTPEEKALWR
jgi:hypothetical protein